VATISVLILASGEYCQKLVSYEYCRIHFIHFSDETCASNSEAGPEWTTSIGMLGNWRTGLLVLVVICIMGPLGTSATISPIILAPDDV
jgi:hypothetical protein